MASAITKYISANRKLSATTWEERVADESMAKQLAGLLDAHQEGPDRAVEALTILFNLHAVKRSEIRVIKDEFDSLTDAEQKEKDKITLCHSFDENTHSFHIHFGEEHTSLEHDRFSILNRLKDAIGAADPEREINIATEFQGSGSALKLRTCQLNLPFYSIIGKAIRSAIDEKISFLKFTPFAPKATFGKE